uniref:Gustatory receptor n=1 Tax=Anopheles atroparvus TaxID=41427 RepID=A0AAG5CWJ0_ANOAO
MFFIDLLKVHLQQLHHRLAELASYMAELQTIPQGSPQYRKVYTRSVDRLLHLKTVYGQLWDINDAINRSFGWSQICNFTANFVDLSCDLYWFYMILVGLHWYIPKVDSTSRCWTVFCVALNFCFVTGLFYWIYQHPKKVLFSDTTQGFLVDYCKFILMVLVYNSLLLENWFNVGKLWKVWMELDQIRIHCIPSSKWSSQQRRHFIIVGSFLAHLSWWELSYAYAIAHTERSRIFTIVFWVLFMLLHLRQLQILLYTDLMGFCLKQINEQLRWMIELSKGASNYGGARSDGQICTQMAKLMDAFARVERLLGLLNRAFGYSFTIIKLITHVYLLADTYWIVYGILLGNVFEGLYLECCLWSKVICLVVNLHSNERIRRECVRMRELLHCVDLGWQLRCDTGYQMVHNFLLKLEVCHPLTLTAMGLFKMEYGIMMELRRTAERHEQKQLVAIPPSGLPQDVASGTRQLPKRPVHPAQALVERTSSNVSVFGKKLM